MIVTMFPTANQSIKSIGKHKSIQWVQIIPRCYSKENKTKCSSNVVESCFLTTIQGESYQFAFFLHPPPSFTVPRLPTQCYPVPQFTGSASGHVDVVPPWQWCLLLMKPLIMEHWSSKPSFLFCYFYFYFYFAIQCINEPSESLQSGNVCCAMAHIQDVATFICAVRFLWEWKCDTASCPGSFIGMKTEQKKWGPGIADKEDKLLNKTANL